MPPEQLLEVKLEDGLGWDEICPFLGDRVPGVPYPRANDPAEFKKLMMAVLAVHWRRTIAGYAAVLAPAVAVGVWYLRRR
ncbi:hypothetical protein IMZ48_17300 [Candidatus Bathyarchaeota archaeon]|nr:hypothetical protein [Candidatus Bathyarchaeota archaeon]